MADKKTVDQLSKMLGKLAAERPNGETFVDDESAKFIRSQLTRESILHGTLGKRPLRCVCHECREKRQELYNAWTTKKEAT
jgi:hypothetical protein